MDHEIVQTLSLLLDEKLQPIKDDISTLKEDINTLKDDVSTLKDDVNTLKDDVNTLKDDVNTLKDDVNTLKDDVNTLKDDVNTLKDDVNTLKDDVNTIKVQQDENTKLIRALVHTSEVNKAEHDKMYNEIIKLSGKVENMRKDLCTVEIVTARNMENIAQLKVAK